MVFITAVVGDESAQVDVLGTAEDVHFDGRIGLFQLRDESFYLGAFGVTLACFLRDTAGTADKVELVEVPPRDDIGFADKIQRTYELYALVVLAFQTGHHGLHL